jgi:DNA-binding response OmpR family regulator
MGRTVLIVDDEKVLRDTLEFVLLTEGHTVFTAVHGRDALRVLEHVSPDVILLDVAMPVMSGREFIREYCDREGPKAPIVICSASIDEAGIQDLGAADYLHKPFGIPELLAAVNGAGQKRARPAEQAVVEPAWMAEVATETTPVEVARVATVRDQRKRTDLTRPLASSIECRGCRKSVPTHLAYSLRGHSGFRCKSCHDLLMEGIARGRSKSLLRDRYRTRT